MPLVPDIPAGTKPPQLPSTVRPPTERKYVRQGSSSAARGIRGTALDIAMHRLAAVVAVSILVAACAGTIQEGMAKLEGQPLSAIVAKIGAPIEERTIEGKKVYIWGSPNTTPPSRDATCQIRATMNGDIVGSLEYQGDEKLCQRYAARLRP
jgi:hypothetical protein